MGAGTSRRSVFYAKWMRPQEPVRDVAGWPRGLNTPSLPQHPRSSGRSAHEGLVNLMDRVAVRSVQPLRSGAGNRTRHPYMKVLLTAGLRSPGVRFLLENGRDSQRSAHFPSATDHRRTPPVTARSDQNEFRESPACAESTARREGFEPPTLRFEYWRGGIWLRSVGWQQPARGGTPQDGRFAANLAGRVVGDAADSGRL